MQRRFVTSQLILDTLERGLLDCEWVNGLMLRGSRAAGTEDRFSDIDVLIGVISGRQVATLDRIDLVVGELGRLDFIYETVKGTNRTYHVAGSSAYLTIDVGTCTYDVLSNEAVVDRGDKQTIQFDKIGQWTRGQFHRPQRPSLQAWLSETAMETSDIFIQARIGKHVQRGDFLSALMNYQAYVLRPLVRANRLIHSVNSERHLSNLYRDLPGNTTRALEELYTVSSAEDIGSKLPKAVGLLRQLLAKLERRVRHSVNEPEQAA